jgi:hypothetical protein
MQQNLISKSGNERVTESGKSVQVKTLICCGYCNMPNLKDKLMRCSGKGCRMMICKGCATFINDKPFCNGCMINIVKTKSLLIITKGKI